MCEFIPHKRKEKKYCREKAQNTNTFDDALKYSSLESNYLCILIILINDLCNLILCMHVCNCG